MGRSSLNIDVVKKDRLELRSLLKGGVQQVRVVLRALALLQLAEDVSAPQIAKTIPLTPQAIRRLGHRYQKAGLGGALYEKQSGGNRDRDVRAAMPRQSENTQAEDTATRSPRVESADEPEPGQDQLGVRPQGSASQVRL